MRMWMQTVTQSCCRTRGQPRQGGRRLARLAQSQQPPATQPAGIKRTILQRVDIPGTTYETVLGVAELSAGASAGRHTHPGPETGTVTEGEMILMIDGQPDKALKMTLKSLFWTRCETTKSSGSV